MVWFIVMGLLLHIVRRRRLVFRFGKSNNLHSVQAVAAARLLSQYVREWISFLPMFPPGLVTVDMLEQWVNCLQISHGTPDGTRKTFLLRLWRFSSWERYLRTFFWGAQNCRPIVPSLKYLGFDLAKVTNCTCYSRLEPAFFLHEYYLGLSFSIAPALIGIPFVQGCSCHHGAKLARKSYVKIQTIFSLVGLEVNMWKNDGTRHYHVFGVNISWNYILGGGNSTDRTWLRGSILKVGTISVGSCIPFFALFSSQVYVHMGDGRSDVIPRYKFSL